MRDVATDLELKAMLCIDASVGVTVICVDVVGVIVPIVGAVDICVVLTVVTGAVIVVVPAVDTSTMVVVLVVDTDAVPVVLPVDAGAVVVVPTTWSVDSGVGDEGVTTAAASVCVVVALAFDAEDCRVKSSIRNRRKSIL